MCPLGRDVDLCLSGRVAQAEDGEPKLLGELALRGLLVMLLKGLLHGRINVELLN
jgi:hypothetical protein